MLSQPEQKTVGYFDSLKSAKILIADERSGAHDSLYEMLLQSGCQQLISASSKDEIFQYLREGYRNPLKQLDLVILSQNHPEIDTQALCQTLSNNQINAVPVIILAKNSGWWDEKQVEKNYQTGAIDILFWPLRITDILPRINLALLYKQEKNSRLQKEESLNNEVSDRRVMETRLNYLLNHDELTSLPSRHRIESALKISISKSRNLHRTCALLYLDVDQFRIINDTMGHERGDRLLIRLSDLLRETAPQNALIARIGSDEFGILIDDVDKIVAMDLALIISQKLEYLICGEVNNQMNISVNIGVVMLTAESSNKSASEVLAWGDQACHIAKQRSDTRIYLYNNEDPEIRELQSTRKCVALVRQAMSNDWFELYLQPIVSLHDNTTSHYEVLIRMTDNQGEMHSPAIFVPAAESTGLIHKLDFWVVDHALSLLQKLSVSQPGVSFSINLSGDGLLTPALLELIKDKIEFHTLNPSCIMFELTETAAVKDVQKTRETISRLRALGCRFAIDDFGTGFSSFNYIKNYPVDFIKIDGMFIQNLLQETTDQILVRSMVEVAHNLGKKVIAEFVENQETADLLKLYGVDYVQGYHFGKPRPAVEVFPTGQ